MNSALAGIRVLDFSRLLPGPLASRWLVEHGAEVIKVEDPSCGDATRWLPPFVGAPPRSSLFEILNAGKKSVAVDLRSDEGRLVARRLVESADVVFESFRPGVMDRLGMGPEELTRLKPDLVYVALSGFGATGPDADRPGHDLGYLARAGGVALGGNVVPGVQMVDVGGAFAAVSAIALALLQRERTGRGVFVDLALSDVALAFGAVAWGKMAGGAQPTLGEELLDGSRPAYSIYAARDGYLAVSALEPKFWSAFCVAIGRPELVPLGLEGGVRGASAREEVQEVLRTRTRDAWVRHFAGVDTCVEPVQLPDEVLNDPHHVARSAVELERGPRSVWRRTSAELEAAPVLGAHTAAMLGELDVPGVARDKVLAQIELTSPK